MTPSPSDWARQIHWPSAQGDLEFEARTFIQARRQWTFNHGCSTFHAVIQQDGHWWIGWIDELPGVNAQGKTIRELMINLGEAFAEGMEFAETDTQHEQS